MPRKRKQTYSSSILSIKSMPFSNASGTWFFRSIPESKSMLAILSLTWGLVVLLALMCLGRLLARVLLPSDRPDPFLTAGWGLAAMIGLGGALNLLGLARAPILILLITTIILADLLSTWLTRDQSQELNPARFPFAFGAYWKSLTWRERGGLLALATLVAVKYASCLGFSLNFWDDKHAYLAEATRMLQTGSIGDNPFSERQIISLNGQVFLNGLFLSVAPSTYAFVMDPGICWIMIAGFTWVILRNDLNASTLVSCVLTAVVLMVRIPEYSPFGMVLNLGGNLSGAVLMLTALRTSYLGLTQGERLALPWLLLLSMTLAGLCAIKTTFLVVAVIFTGTWYGLRLLSSRRYDVAFEFVIVGIFTTALLSPWMLQQYHSGGTLLYPFLGHGTHIVTPELANFGGPFRYKLIALAEFSCSGLMIPGIIAMFLLGNMALREPRDLLRSSWAMLVAAIITSMIVTYQGGIQNSTNFHRYVQPILYVALIPAGLVGVIRLQPSSIGLAICLAVFIGNQWTDMPNLIRPIISIIRGTEPDFRFFTEAELTRIHQAQQAIPPGAKVLVSCSSISQLDFNRNTIWNLDFPGMCSPGSSMPLPAKFDELISFIEDYSKSLPTPLPCNELRVYLRQTGVEYLIFSQEPNIAINEGPINWFPRWPRIVKTLGVLYSEQLKELITECPIVYAEGEITVIDLSAPRHAP